MSHIPYLDLKAQFQGLRSDVLSALEGVCESTRFAQGPPTADFERAFASYCGARHCVTLNSGTSALHLALLCLNVGPGDEVITTPFTFIATAWAISYVGARPVFVDIDPKRRTLDPKKLEAAITPRTKAILPVHLFGMPADMDPILEIARRHGLGVVEDAAQAHGARYKGRRVGALGGMGCFSFYPTKNLGAFGEGGALVPDADAFAARTRSLRDHAQTQRYHHGEIGYNYRMDSFQGAVLGIKLRQLDAWNAARARCAALYTKLLAGSAIEPPATFPDSECVWHAYTVECDQRDALRARLAAAEIDTGIYYPIPLHLQKPYQYLGYHAGDFPVSERLCARCFALPIYPELPDSAVERIAAELAGKV